VRKPCRTLFDMCCQPRSPFLPVFLLFLARPGDASRLAMTEVDPDNKIDASPELLSGHHSHHEHHQHHKHKRACVPRLEAVTSAELGLIRKMMTVHEPDKLGTGRDVVSREGERSGYNALEVVAAWKVDPKAKPMQAYIRLRNKLNSARSSGDHWVPTALDAAVTQSRQNGLLGDNEYWMLQEALPTTWRVSFVTVQLFQGLGRSARVCTWQTRQTKWTSMCSSTAEPIISRPCLSSRWTTMLMPLLNVRAVSTLPT